MSSAIEVLKSEKGLYIEKIKEIESRFNGMPFDIKESYQKSVKVYQEFIDALDEAIVALEKLERVTEITEHWESWYELDENGTGLEDLVDDLKDILNTKKVGEQK